MTCTTRSKLKVTIILREFIDTLTIKILNTKLTLKRAEVQYTTNKKSTKTKTKTKTKTFILDISLKFNQLSINYTKYHKFNQ